MTSRRRGSPPSKPPPPVAVLHHISDVSRIPITGVIGTVHSRNYFRVIPPASSTSPLIHQRAAAAATSGDKDDKQPIMTNYVNREK